MRSSKPNGYRCNVTLSVSPPVVSHTLGIILVLLLGPLTLKTTHASETPLVSAAVSENASLRESTDDNAPASRLVNAIKDNLRFTLDFSSRATDFVARDETGYTHAVGFDSYKVISGATRDIGTAILQVYLTRIDNMVKRPGFFDGKDDTELVYRIFNFNLTALPGNLPNIRVGHFEVPYGLEHSINTNGTLRQYGQPRNLGIKADWGLSLNKQHTRFEYEVGATTGGGQSLGRQNGSFVYAARVGTLRDANRVFGLSLYRSELGGLLRNRYGVDAQFFAGRHGLLTEISLGNNDGTDVLNGLVEWNFRNRRESLLFYTQFGYFSEDRANGNESATNAKIGVRFQPNNHWSVSAQYTRDLDTFSGANKERDLSLQLRFRL